MDFRNLPVMDMSPATTRPEALTPETPVIVINRGYTTLTRKFDGYDYPLRPHTEGLMRMPYGAAMHFAKHCTVPGSRDAATAAEQSFIGIIENATTGAPIDPPEFCEPFTHEQCAKFGVAIEAIARDKGEVETVEVSSAVTAGRVPVGRQSSGGRGKRLTRETHGDTATAMASPTEPNEAQQEIAQAEQEMAEAGEP